MPEQQYPPDGVQAAPLYYTVGMQSLINIIRSTDATNVIQIVGTEYANSTTSMLTPGIALTDTNGVTTPQLMVAADIYPESNICDGTDSPPCSVNDYNSAYGKIINPKIGNMPFMAGEMGEDGDAFGDGDTDTVDTLIGWLNQNGASGYNAWEWDNFGSYLDLISYDTFTFDGSILPDTNGDSNGFSTGDEQAPWGTDYRNTLASLNANGVTISSFTASPSTITAGGSTTLKWTSNAANCTGHSFPASSFSGNQAPNNSTGVKVTPTSSTSYTLVCESATGLQYTSNLDVAVNSSGGGLVGEPFVVVPGNGGPLSVILTAAIKA